MTEPAPQPRPEPRWLRVLEAAVGALADLGTALAGLALLVSLGLVAYSVVLRYAFNHPQSWVDEIVGYLLVATVMLAARFDAYAAVVAGTTLGMMLANVPVVFLGERMTRLVPLRVVHILSAIIFLGLGLFALFG